MKLMTFGQDILKNKDKYEEFNNNQEYNFIINKSVVLPNANKY